MVATSEAAWPRLLAVVCAQVCLGQLGNAEDLGSVDDARALDDARRLDNSPWGVLKYTATLSVEDHAQAAQLLAILNLDNVQAQVETAVQETPSLQNISGIELATSTDLTSAFWVGGVECEDTDDGARDSQNRTCFHYSRNPRGCRRAGKLTYLTFNAERMCCACGGGSNLTQETTADDDVNMSTSFWKVNEGPCWTNGTCVFASGWASPGYLRSYYGFDEYCNVTADFPEGYFLQGQSWLTPFATEEKYDELQVNGEMYSGDIGPEEGVHAVGVVTWSSDFSVSDGGWALCATTCPVGTKVVESELQANLLSCEECEPGKFGNETGRFDCLECPLGRFSTEKGQSECQPCEEGTFVDRLGQQECQECHPGRFASATGSSSCEHCRPQNYPDASLWTTLQRSPIGRWVEMSKAKSEENCGCKPAEYGSLGAWEKCDDYVTKRGCMCVACEEGMVCIGMGDFNLSQGYFSRADHLAFIWRCHEDVYFNQCPGGAPGTCGEHRDNESIACLQCQAGMVPGLDRSCVDCESGGFWIMLVVMAMVGVGLVTAYMTIANENKAVADSAVSILVVALSILFTTGQVMTVLDAMNVPWPMPFSEWLEWAELLTWRLAMMNVGCVLPDTPVVTYSLKLIGMAAMLAVLFVIHVVHVSVFHKRAFIARMGAFIGTAGAIFMAFFISIAKLIFTPWQCEPHPNGEWTMENNKRVVCFKSEYESPPSTINETPHMTIIYIAICAALIPVGFLAVSSWAVQQLPGRLLKGDTAFLHRYSFLFIRFRPERYWYILVMLFRNFFIALVPVIPEAFVQVIGVAFLVMVTTSVTPYCRPWRVAIGNTLEIAANFSILFALVFAGFLVPNVDGNIVGNICCAIAVVLMVAFIVAFLYVSFLKVQIWQRKSNEIFLCFDKKGGGCLARLLSVKIEQLPGMKKKVVLGEDVKDPSDLFHYIEDSNKFVAICTKQILTRKWSVAQMHKARSLDIDTLLLIMPGFQLPDISDKIAARRTLKYMPSIEELARYEISPDHIVDTMRWLHLCQSTELKGDISDNYITSLSSRLVQRWAKDVPEDWPEAKRDEFDGVNVNTVFIVDTTNTEAVCAAHTLREMLRLRLRPATAAHYHPQVLQEGDSLPASATKAFVICSEGCLDEAVMLQALVELVHQDGIDILPVVVDFTFQPPSESSWEKAHPLRDSNMWNNNVMNNNNNNSNDNNTNSVPRATTADDVDFEVVRRVFRDGTIEFCPWQSRKVLEVRVKVVKHFWDLGGMPDDEQAARPQQAAPPPQSPPQSPPARQVLDLSFEHLIEAAAADRDPECDSAAGQSPGVEEWLNSARDELRRADAEACLNSARDELPGSAASHQPAGDAKGVEFLIEVEEDSHENIPEIELMEDMPPVQPRASAEPIMKEYTPVLCPKEARAQEDEGADYAPACDSELVSI